MKKIDFEDVSGQSTCSLYFEHTNDVYRLFVGIQTADALVETLFDLKAHEIEQILKRYNALINSKEDNLEWKSSSQEYTLRLSLDVDKLNCSFEITKDNFRGHFEFIVSPDFTIEEDDYSLLLGNKFNAMDFDVCKVNTKNDSADFELVYETNNIKIKKNFWLYDFECNEIRQQLLMFLSTGKEANISINDSFLWIHLFQNNRMKIEFDTMCLPSSSIECELPISHLDIERILAAMQ